MKNTILKTAFLTVGLALSLTACHDLDMNPLSSGSTENWYSNLEEVRMAVNAGYNNEYLLVDGELGESNNEWSDDSHFRQAVDAFQNATLNSQDWRISRRWKANYAVISKMNSVINKYHRAIEYGANASQINQLVGEAYFFRGRAYGELVFHWGDVPYYTDDISIDEALKMGRTPKEEVLKHIYEDFDSAAARLPETTTGRVSLGAALAFKARYALYMGDYQTAATSAKAVMDLGVYSLESNYSKLFLPSTQTSSEFIFIVPRSIANNLNVIPSSQISNVIPRNNGGFICRDPTWDLLAAYTCTDGKPIDESPLFDPHNPFKNRDPRCAMTITAFGSELLGYIYDPSPVALQTKRISGNDTTMVYNNDSRSNKMYASFDGLCWRKSVGQEWLDHGKQGENPKILMRYADVLLMYAEAKIELNQIDQSVIDAMNKVRARAYGVDPSATSKYPAFTIQSQAKMRYELRTERRMELAYENLRYADLIRWKLAPIAFSRKIYMLLDPESEKKLYAAGNWFWGITPKIDENGLPDFSALEAAGLCAPAAERHWK